MTPGILINIDVDDLQRATAFYTALLDLRIARRFGAGGVELVGGGVPLYLLVKPAGSIASPASSGERRHYGRHWTPVHLDFVVANVDAAVECALAAGATLDDPAITHAGDASPISPIRSATASVCCSFWAAAMTRSRRVRAARAACIGKFVLLLFSRFLEGEEAATWSWKGKSAI